MTELSSEAQLLSKCTEACACIQRAVVLPWHFVSDVSDCVVCNAETVFAGVMELYPKLQPGTYKDAAAFEAELPSLTLEPYNATTAEQQAVEDAPRRSLGTSISSAVQDVKEHLHLKGGTGTGR